ncbi:very long chain fatty acid elongase AAEL008004 [Tribolium castaneum]|nr:PREDICTED: elongation of very long chain fatty acids protein AAEL008004-like [Tribolium castaneum]|eukprot:XP_008199652.2 PREDICTED: elongation of very long chain fatty acids protein AAEL008004-like [Tribolium castaneum]
MIDSQTFDSNYTLSLKNYEDPRTSNWFLMSSPGPTVAVCLSYVFLVKFVGPKVMEKKNPFSLRKILMAYNFFQVIFSAWLFYEFCASGWLTGEYSFRCQPIDISANPRTMRMVNVTWWYFFSKFTELVETIFFIMRKKFNQVNALHVFHHGIMPVSAWVATKYYPNGHGTFPGLLNTFVHVIMYSYYFLSAFGPEVQKYLWWKKYLTRLQMIQFVIIMFHALQLLVVDCNFPRIFIWYMGLLALSFYTLFKNFYDKEYKAKQNNKCK